MNKKLSLFAIALGMLATVSVEAQVNHRRGQDGFYRIPGTYTRMYPAPRYEYRFGGTRVYSPYRLRVWQNPNYNWPYGYRNGYDWPYGYPRDYRGPYGYGNR